MLKPQPAYDIVKAIKDGIGRTAVRVHVHVHATTGVTLVSLMKAIEAGADGVDTAISSFSLGPGHNPTESLVQMLEGTGYTTNLDMERLLKIRDHFATVRPRYTEFLSNITGRRHRNLHQPNSRRHDFEHGKPAEAARRGRQVTGSTNGSTSGAQSRGLSPAGDSIQPDLWEPSRSSTF